MSSLEFCLFVFTSKKKTKSSPQQKKKSSSWYLSTDGKLWTRYTTPHKLFPLTYGWISESTLFPSQLTEVTVLLKTWSCLLQTDYLNGLQGIHQSRLKYLTDSACIKFIQGREPLLQNSANTFFFLLWGATEETKWQLNIYFQFVAM